MISQKNNKALPLFHAMAGFGAPETSHLKTAVIPSVTVVSVGSRENVGAISGIKVFFVPKDQFLERSLNYLWNFVSIFIRLVMDQGMTTIT